MLSSNCAVYGSKKSIYIKERDVSGFLTDLLNIKTIFEGISIMKNIVWRYKTNVIVNNFLLVADGFMSQVHLRQPIKTT